MRLKFFSTFITTMFGVMCHNPQTFLLAGTLQATHKRAALKRSGITREPECLKLTPSSQSFINSSTSGVRKELMLFQGSFGPGIIPTRKMFCRLKRSLLGRFINTRYRTPTEYGV